MAQLMNAIVRFDAEAVSALQQTRQRADAAVVELGNDIAYKVIEAGGYCDELTFATVFYGGIDPSMSWGDDYTNEQLAAPEIPEEFRRAQHIGRTLSYSWYEPFVALQEHNKDAIGIIMPASGSFDGHGVGYRISAYEPWHPKARDFTGDMVFNGYSKLRPYRPYDEHSFFSVVRHEAGLKAVTAPVRLLRIGMAAAREHVYSRREHFSEQDREELDSYIEELRAAAKAEVDSMKAATSV